MRISVRVTLGILAVVFAGLFTLGVGPAVAAGGPAAATGVGPAVAAGVGPVVAAPPHAAAPTTPKPPVTTTPGTDFNKGQQAANAALAKRKLVMGIACVVLLVIVYIGHRAKGRHILRVKNLQNAKG